MPIHFRPSRLLAALGCLLLQCLPLTAAAEQYYVAESGSDANPGTSTSAPWRDLTTAVRRLSDGDVLTVLDEYHVTVPVKINKRAIKAPITINALATGMSKQRQIICALPDTDTACIRIENASQVVLSDLRVEGSRSPRASLVYAQNSDNIRVTGGDFRNAGVYGIWLDGRQPADHDYTIEHNRFVDSGNNPIYLLNTVGLKVTDNNIDKVSAGDGIVLVDVLNADVIHNTVRNLLQVVGLNGRDGIKIRPSENVLIQDNWVETVTGTGIYLIGPYGGSKRHKNIRILHNTVTDAARVNMGKPDPDCIGGKWPSALNASRVDYVTLLDNTVYNNYGEGIALNHATQGTVRRNHAHDNFGVNIYLNNAAHMLVDRNDAINNPDLTAYYRCRAPATGISMANETFGEEDNFVALEVIQLSNNILVNGRHGINFFWKAEGGLYHPGGLSNVHILNNTVYRSWKTMLEIIDTDMHAENEIQSNIWVPGADTITAASVPTLGFDCRANLWWASGSLSSCTSLNDVVADPRFVQQGALKPEGYKIAYGSPAINAASYTEPEAVRTSAHGWWDYFGTTRTEDDPWDIGAHEYRKKAR